MINSLFPTRIAIFSGANPAWVVWGINCLQSFHEHKNIYELTITHQSGGEPADRCARKALYSYVFNNLHGKITQFWLVKINAVFR